MAPAHQARHAGPSLPVRPHPDANPSGLPIRKYPARSHASTRLTVPETRHLLIASFAPPAMTAARLLHRSTWRRRHQATARRSHYQRRSADGPTE